MIQVILATFVSRGIAAIGFVALSYILATVLGADGVGKFMHSFAIVSGISLFSKFGLENAIVRFCGASWSIGDYLGFRAVVHLAYILSGCAAIIAIAVYFILCFFDDSLTVSISLSFMLSLLPLTTLAITASILKSLARPIIAPVFEQGGIGFALSGLIVVVSAAVPMLTYDTIVCAYISVLVVLNIVGFCILVRRLPIDAYFPIKIVRISAVTKALPSFFLITLANYTFQWAPIAILGLFETEKEVGVFGTVVRVAFLVNFVLNVVNSIVGPKFAGLHKKGLDYELIKLLNKSRFYMTILALPPLCVCMLFSETILGFFGPEFKAASDMLIVLSLAQFVNVITGSVGLMLSMTGQEKKLMKLTFVVTSISLILLYVLSSRFGAWGATCAVSFGLVVQNISAALIVRNNFTRSINLRT